MVRFAPVLDLELSEVQAAVQEFGMEGALVAGVSRDFLGTLAIANEGLGEEVFIVRDGVASCLGSGADLGGAFIEKSGFAIGAAAEAPGGNGEALQGGACGGIGGRGSVGPLRGEVLECGGVFGGDGVFAGGEPVTEAVAAGAVFAGGGAGTGGSLRVAAIGFDLCWCGHTRFDCWGRGGAGDGVRGW
ncbi:MAG: hypothetical protein U0Q18_04630 [Bryobacteraceae bacterium]